MEEFTIEPLLTSQLEGEIPASLAPEMWVKAHREKFSGSLFILTDTDARTAFRFVRGCADRFHCVLGRQQVLEALSEHLPPEQLDLVRSHARQFVVDELTAVERLRLLPAESLQHLHRDCMLRELILLTETPGQLRFRYVTGSDCFSAQPGFSHPVDNLPLLTECLLQHQDLSWFQGRLSSRRHDVLRLCGEAARPGLVFQGMLRQVVLALRRRAETFENLRLRGIAHEDALVATIYALRATGCIQRINQQATSRPTTAIRFTGPPAEGLQPGTPFAPAWASAAPPGSAPPPSAGETARPQAGMPTSTSGIRSIDLRGVSLPPAGKSTLPPQGSSSSKAATLPPRTTARPCTSATIPPSTRSHGPPSSGSSRDEPALESAALGAWMRAVDDPACRRKALKIVERACDSFPNNPRILFYLGCLLALNQRHEEAEATMRRVLDFDPEHIEAQRELAKLKKQNDEGGKKQSLLHRWTGRRSG